MDNSPSIRVLEMESGILELIAEVTRIEVPCAAELLPSRDVHLDEDEGAPLADPLVGRVVADRYRIVEPLGRGGMGIVYKVEHTRIGKLLAMKLLDGELSRHPELVRRFKREALAVSKLSSPNTVQVFDFGASDGLTYLVMELVGGDDLGRVLRRDGPLPFARVGKIVVQICSALAEAHKKGIVHRDIKPENIMLLTAAGGADVVKVLDFGLAKLRGAEGLADISGQGAVVGTPYYMAPEQIRAEDVDARADVYGVGALMYRLLTGVHPFAGPPMTVLSRHLHEIPVPPAERAPELRIPQGISAIVMRALLKNPDYRFQRIEDLQHAVIEEMRAGGSASVDHLLDADRLRRLARTAEPISGPLRSIAVGAATRDEVDAYERKLRRTRYGAMGAAVGMAVAAVATTALLMPHDRAFAGVEIEPNDTAAEAMPIPLGQTVRGHLGRRMDALHGDRDFYAIDLPARGAAESAFLSLRVGAIPNLAMCTTIYRVGFPDPVGQYCVGRPGRDLVLPALALPPGRYLLAVMQDLASYGGAPPFIHENISDTYALLSESVVPEPGAEIEPNDQIASATPVGLGLPCSAQVGWARDEDVFCLPEGVSGHIRWNVRGGIGDAVLEAVALRGTAESAAARIESGRPWQSEPILADGFVRQCLRVRIASGPAGGGDRYVVEAEGLP